MDLGKAGLSLYDPLRLLEKIKPLVLEKFKKKYKNKTTIDFCVFNEKKNPATREETIDKAHFHSYYEKNL